jgi:hypothetical protein
MSLIKKRNTNLSAYSNKVKQNYYMSTYYALTNTDVFIDFQNSIFFNNNSNFFLQNYTVDFGDGSTPVLINPNQKAHHKYTAAGIYNVSYSANYFQNSQSLNLQYKTELPFIIKNRWETYNPNYVRTNDEIVLDLPYTFDQIEIQPNEWGVEDIFNTSIYRLQECLDYLNNKSQIINTYSPTLYFGWLGNLIGTSSSFLQWSTQSYRSTYVNNPELSKSSGISYFENVIDAIETQINDDSILYILDNYRLRIFNNGAIPSEINIFAGDDTSFFLSNPISIDVNENGDVLYIADQIENVIYKIKFSLIDADNHKGNINIQLFTGGFGGLIDNNNFNTPTQVCYSNNNVYVLDYNNYCIKQYNQDLNWLFTYSIDSFNNDRPISIASFKNGLLYVLTEKYNVYIFDNKSNSVFEYFPIKEANDGYSLNKISIDETEDFIFILTEQFIYKYTLSGSYVTTVNIPKTNDVKYTNIKKSKNGTLIISSNKCILKCQDILQTFKLGEGLPYEYWSKEQLSVSKNEFVSDLIYNRSLIRMVQNIKTFRDTLNSRFVIATENVRNNIVTYFSYLPIDKTEFPTFSEDIEQENLGVGVNELHTPSVINKELEKIYNSLLILNNFLSIKNYVVGNEDCLESFCWSWDATSCYKLKLPVLKTCSINPISYQELLAQEQSIDMMYAPNTTWGDSISKCCDKE